MDEAANTLRVERQASGDDWPYRTGRDLNPAERVIPGYRHFQREFESGVARKASQMPADEKAIVVLASLALLRQHACLREQIETALDQGLTARAISEVLLQAGIYGGFLMTEEAAAVADEVFMARSIEPDREGLTPESNETLKDEALAYRTMLHGKRRDAGHADPEGRMTGELYEIAAVYGYGLIWRRPGLTSRQRLVVALASFATIGSLEEFFAKFAISAIHHGISEQEVVAILIHLSPYIGFPRGLKALHAFAQAHGE